MKRILLLLLFGLGIFSAQSQITVDNTLTVQQLIDDVLVLGECAEVNNIVSPMNSDVAGLGFDSYGAFDSTTTPQFFPFDSGIILATNGVDMIPTGAPNQNGGNPPWLGDTDLDALIQEPNNTNNATVIEFDFIPFVDQISFNYMFASDEYPSFVCSFADTFAFIISGPGISNVNDYNHDANPNTPDVTLDLGGQNIAVIPGTTIPVSPVNIHQNPNCATGSLGEFAVPQLFDDVNSDNGSTMYNGQVVPLTAVADVIPGQTYSIKLVIADRGDTILNSAVFIESASFDLGGIDLGPDITIAGGNAPCEGDTVTLDAGFSAANIQYFWAQDGTIIPGENSQTLDVTESGVYEVGIQIGAGGTACFGVSNQVTVEFYPEPTFDVAPPIDLCAGDSVILDGTPSNASAYTSIDYQWSKDGTDLTGETNATLNVTEGGLYEVIVDANACDDATTSFTVNLIDYQVAIQDLNQDCINAGDTVTLTPEFTGLTQDQIDNEVTYEWTTDNGVFNTPSIDISEGQSVTLTTTFNGCDETITETFTFFNNPIVNISGPTTLCQGDTITLDGTPSNLANLTGVNYTWSKDGTDLPGETNATIDVTESGTYEVTVDNNGCATSGTINVELIDYQVTLPTVADPCLNAGDTVTLSPEFTGLTQDQIDNEVTYEWTTDNGVLNTPTIDISEGQSVTLTTTFNGCDETITETFTFFNNPIVNISGPTTLCQGGTITLDGTPSNLANLTGVNYTWSKDGTDLPGETNATIDVTESGTYEVTVDNNGCATSSTIDVELIDYQVTLPTVADPCIGSGETVTIGVEFTGLTDDEVNQVTYQWSTGDDTPTIELTQGQEVTLTTSFNGCEESVTETFTFFNNPEVDIAGNAILCSGETNTLDATPMNLNDLVSPTYSWTLDGNPTPGDTSVLDISEGGTYEVTIDNNGCTVTDTFDVEFIEYTVSFANNDIEQIQCTGDGEPNTVLLEPIIDGLTAAQQNQIFYNWSDGSTGETLTVSNSGNYSVEVNIDGNCFQSSTAQVSIINIETIQATISDAVKCPEDPVTLEPVLSSNVSGLTYQWSLDGNVLADETGSSITVTEEGEYSLVVNNQGCLSNSVTATVSGYDVDNCVITQGISPNVNTDGINDCMDLTWLNEESGIRKMTVFNRYGRKVFEENNYIDTFCGQDENGDELATGTYFYVIELERESTKLRKGPVIKGWVYVNAEQ